MGNGTIRLTAPSAGSYAGVLVFQDRAVARPLTISGNGALAGLSGTIYGPVMPVSIVGNGTTGVQLLVGTLALNGDGDITFQFPGARTRASRVGEPDGEGPVEGLGI
jgi:hypothetical protein